jgi:hemolysin activation/secretion protein
MMVPRRLAPLLALPLLLPIAVASQPAGQVPPGSPVPRILPAPPPAVGPAAAPAPLPAAQDLPAVAVPVTAVRIEGATAYPEATLAPLVGGLTGPSVPLARIEEARLNLLRRYRDDGYVLTGVSAEVAAGGLLRFVVAEGRISEVRLDGDIGPAATQVLLFLEQLVTAGPLSQALLERQLLLAQEVPGVSVRAVLRPMPGGEPGALQLVAQLARAPVSTVLAADNRGFRLVGPEQAVAAVSLNSFTQYGERTDLVLFRAGGNTQLFGQVATEVHLGASGLRGRVYAGRGEARPSDNLRAIRYRGTTTLFGLGLSYPMIRSRQQTLTLLAGLEALESEVEVAGAGGDVRASFDSLRVIRIGADWARQDVLFGDALSAQNAASFRISQGIEALGASRNGAALPGRIGQEVDFLKVSGELSRNQTLFVPWDGATVSLFGLVAGQWTNARLPSPEKFFLGGLRLNRGFYAGEVSGDRALSTVAELRLDTNHQLPIFDRNFDLAAQYYVFYDWGQSWEVEKDIPDRVLRSAGGGVRLVVDRTTELQLEGVTRMTRRPQGGQGVDALSSQAVYWRVLTRF